ncbi:hypothetical protein RND81_04G027400 [Saponaria officinalis]|uniref:Myb-like domain-containing protein n=1 Tax=Saponaria officinalis TaxID=3572 RepID=A0AAW1LH38_SAPOF
MFDGMPDHFYQFLAATSRATNNTTSNFQQQHQQQQHEQQPNFDASFVIHHPQLPLHFQQQQQHQQQQHCTRNETVSPWSNEEVVALIKIRSSLDNNHPWFPPEFTWENVSRKLEEIGFKRSAENCKQKFEEETRSFNNNNDNNIVINSHKNHIVSQNYRLFGELEELYNCNHDHDNNNNELDVLPNDSRSMSISTKNESQDRNDENTNEGEEQEKPGNDGIGEREQQEQDRDDDDDVVEELGGVQLSVLEEETKKAGRKRKREKKFEMFKGFCEKIVNKMMAKQEEFHCKILQEMVKRNEEKIAREEAWKKQEIDIITKELEFRAHEQAMVGDRQAKILGILNKFSSSSTNVVEDEKIKVQHTTTSLSTSSSILSQDYGTHEQNSISNLVTHQKCNLPTSISKENFPKNLENPTLGLLPLKSPNPMTSISTTRKSFAASNHTSTDAADDTRRRWPRDEVLELINIRCSLFNNNDDHNDKETVSKGPLWERISQKMLELGYRRSSKRCKEKWENINKYFRKTKDLNKKRSSESRTCPYFDQLSHLYNQGPAPCDQLDRRENVVGSPPENRSMAMSGGQGGSSTSNGAATCTTMHGNEGGVVQMSAEFGFEF